MVRMKQKISYVWKNYSFIFIFALILAIYIGVSSSLTWGGITNILRHSAVIGLVALGAGVVILTGEIDLSVGSVLAFTAGAGVCIFNMTASPILTLLCCLFCGGMCGLFNGILVGRAKMPSFIVTLAAMLIYRSLTQYFCQALGTSITGGGNSLYKMSREIATYETIYGFGNGKVLTIPNAGWLLMLFACLYIYMTTSTKFGKRIYAIGSNEKSARLAGIDVPGNRIAVFFLSGLMAGLGAFLWCAMNGSCDPATTGNSYEMYAIAAVVLGGISMSGGRGKVIGIFFGTLSYTIIDKIIVALKMHSLINDTVKGVILIVAILIQTAGPEIKAYLNQCYKKRKDVDANLL